MGRIATWFVSLCGRHAWTILICAAVLSALLQVALLRHFGFEATDASAASASAVMGLMHGRGLTVSAAEANAAWSNDPERELLVEYRPDAPRMQAHQPLPGFIAVMAACAYLTGHLRYLWIIYLQFGLHIGLSVLLARELMLRSRLHGVLVGVVWLLFLPFMRVNLMVRYDAWTSFLSLGLTIAGLCYIRRPSLPGILLCGVLGGAGLWMRDYFFVLPVVVFLILAFLVRPPWRHLVVYAFVVVLFGVALMHFRSWAPGVEAQITRGSTWHTFWAGVGQFDNDVGVANDDDSVLRLATRLSGGRDFSFFYYEFDPEYNRVLGDLGRTYIRSHPWSLVRNACYRCVYLMSPGLMPSYTLVVTLWGKLLTGAVSIVISLLAVVGFLTEWRYDRRRAAILLAPWLALFPLAPFYLTLPVTMLVYFVFVVFACLTISEWLTRRCSVGKSAPPLPNLAA